MSGTYLLRPNNVSGDLTNGCVNNLYFSMTKFPKHTIVDEDRQMQFTNHAWGWTDVQGVGWGIFPRVLIRCYYRKSFRHHFSSSFLTLRKQVVVEYLYVSSRQTTMNGKGSIRKFLFTCPVTALPLSYRRRLNLCTALSTIPAAHPGLPAATCICFVGLL